MNIFTREVPDVFFVARGEINSEKGWQAFVRDGGVRVHMDGVSEIIQAPFPINAAGQELRAIPWLRSVANVLINCFPG